MTENEARNIIYQAFVDGWSPTAPTVPYTFENEEFDSIPEWVRVSVLSTVGGQWTLGQPGNRVYRRRGAVFVEIRSAVDRGLRRLDELTKAARDLYEGHNHSQVMFNDGIILGRPNDGKWARGDVSVFFTYDETK